MILSEQQGNILPIEDIDLFWSLPFVIHAYFLLSISMTQLFCTFSYRMVNVQVIKANTNLSDVLGTALKALTEVKVAAKKRAALVNLAILFYFVEICEL